MLKYAIDYEGPIALRYPRGEAYDGLQEFRAPVVYGKSELLYDECGLALVAVGSMVKTGAAGAGDAQGHRLQLYDRERTLCKAG